MGSWCICFPGKEPWLSSMNFVNTIDWELQGALPVRQQHMASTPITYTSLVSTISHWYLMNFQVPKLIFWLCFTTLCNLLWKLVTLCQPIKCNTKPICDLVIPLFRIFQALVKSCVVSLFLEFSTGSCDRYMWSDCTWDNNSVSFTKHFQWVFYLTLHADADFLTNLPLSENDTTPCLNVIGEFLSTRCLVISSKG